MESLRNTGRHLFLALEHLFNAAFGDRLNPFYRLGEISFLLFWIAVASGIYLYAFFRTSVHEAYASVEALNTIQPWLGGVLRSVHRYASDAMVVTMLLHLLRHFCFDRYRGYRWFSWISGVGVLWLVYASGVNGFMLPWDALAQFTVVATTEFLDGSPLFSGQLARNFITDAAVSDRLFSLLSFLHIGIPLVLLLLLWIHIQRVPRARSVPPVPIALPLALSLIGLSLAQPVRSTAVAALSHLPESLTFDWFYLATFPVMYEHGIAVAWAMLAGGTLLLALMPWLPPRRGRGGWRGGWLRGREGRGGQKGTPQRQGRQLGLGPLQARHESDSHRSGQKGSRRGDRDRRCRPPLCDTPGRERWGQARDRPLRLRPRCRPSRRGGERPLRHRRAQTVR